MSLNLGTPAYEAIKELRTTSSWTVFCLAIEELARSKLHAALESPVDNRIDATAYARAVHDIHVALYASTHSLQLRQVGKLSSKAPEKADKNAMVDA